jgi:hypothetical protein
MEDAGKSMVSVPPAIVTGATTRVTWGVSSET